MTSPRFRSLWRLDAEQRRIVLASLVLLPCVRLSLKFRGFVNTADVLARWSIRTAESPNAPRARAVADAVGIVARRTLVGSRCLGRSLVLWFLLRRRGIDADLVLGARAAVDGEFLAHAWVEVAGEVVNDMPDVREQFGSFDVQLPSLARTFRP